MTCGVSVARPRSFTSPSSYTRWALAIPLIQRAEIHRDRTAIAAGGKTFSYRELLGASARVAGGLLGGAADLAGQRVAFLVPPAFDHVAIQWGIWRAGGVAVPLCLTHPHPELLYVIEDCGAETVVVAPDYAERLSPLAERLNLRQTPELSSGVELPLPEIESSRPAMIVYTSGTTGGPKGVVTTHQNIRSQIESLVEAWEWQATDRILLVLPLHHVHGIINVLGCALWSGATCEMLPRFDPEEVWLRFAARQLTLFMAVPTIYSRLAATWVSAPTARRQQWSSACNGLRLMVSGSAALPVKLFEDWQEISGHTLLERYGMTELGMVLSNPLHGERVAGHVGTALPGVEVRRVDAEGRPVVPEEPGEIEVRGPGVFKEYWNRPLETERAWRDGWFRTGDIAVEESGTYRILGRQSVDIIKTGGYKVSALEVEEGLREHPRIAECAVVGLPDEEWGERVAAAVVLTDAATLELDELRSWAKDRIAAYKTPTRLLIVEALPRNPLGKVNKPELKHLFGQA